MIGIMDGFLFAMDDAALSFDVYGFRSVGRPLYNKTKFVPIFRHVGVGKQWLISVQIYE
jgi:hypothetical protein